MYDLIIRQTHMTLPIGTIYCLGKNYQKHIREMGGPQPASPVVFLKPRTALVHPRGAIRCPEISREMHHEVELVVVLGKGGKRIPEAEAMQHVLGFAIGIDMTLRDVQARAKERGEPWAVAKGFDTSAPIGDVLLREELPDPHGVTLRLSVNNVVRQEGSTSKMMMTIPAIVSYLSTIFTLERGDCIFTGTPEGVGRVDPGDRIVAEIVGHSTAEWSVV